MATLTQTTTAKTATGPAPGITKLARTIVYVRDFDRALRFYTETLGLTLAYPADGGWAELVTGDAALCLHAGREGTASTKHVTSVGLAVADFDRAHAALVAKGVAISAPFSPCGGLRVAHFEDLDGNWLSIEG